ncbi:metallophosphoesterase [Sphingobacterium sp. UT-1RO-CII-1]|uniref:metallophosphoesterase family protein n=1 Tax=Sphingobacterium sp. UT-1RO-CII-1 TaxID=2995225 RepID=UPI00227B9CC9|nr:metallophosphoesterase [Sphingobacterium sp. UT-1RO-CII-1]MCY4781728.1 metallophosphoesterase [Sphingobacterium sp. UT-1RO-CII-1]
MNKSKKENVYFSRKEFLKLGSLGLGGLLFTQTAKAKNTTNLKKQAIRFGVISDLHYDLMHDADERASQFINEMNRQQPDFIIQLGDFCVPKPENLKLMEIWNQFKGDKHHVLGNHDTDGGFTTTEALQFWNSPAAYYSFDKNNMHFIILNGNEKPTGSTLQGYPRHIDEKQLTWLKEDLQKTKLRTVIFCHQAFDNTDNGLENGMQLRYLFEQINKEAGYSKVILVLSGHHHSNYHNHINNIHYVQINSSSYYWVEGDYKSNAFSDDFYKQYPILRHTIVYKDPIWAMVEIDGKNKIKIKGKTSVFAGTEQEAPVGLTDVYPVTAKIDDRELFY